LVFASFAPLSLRFLTCSCVCTCQLQQGWGSQSSLSDAFEYVVIHGSVGLPNPPTITLYPFARHLKPVDIDWRFSDLVSFDGLAPEAGSLADHREKGVIVYPNNAQYPDVDVALNLCWSQQTAKGRVAGKAGYTRAHTQITTASKDPFKDHKFSRGMFGDSQGQAHNGVELMELAFGQNQVFRFALADYMSKETTSPNGETKRASVYKTAPTGKRAVYPPTVKYLLVSTLAKETLAKRNTIRGVHVDHFPFAYFVPKEELEKLPFLSGGALLHVSAESSDQGHSEASEEKGS
jgi:hypothetical protein